MSKSSQFVLALGIRGNKTEAYEFYHKAFGVTKTSEEGTVNEADHLIYMDINGVTVLLGPDDGEIAIGNTTYCCLKFDKEEDLRKAYDTLIQGGQNYSIGSYPFTPLGAGVTDKYGIVWWLAV